METSDIAEAISALRIRENTPQRNVGVWRAGEASPLWLTSLNRTDHESCFSCGQTVTGSSHNLPRYDPDGWPLSRRGGAESSVGKTAADSSDRPSAARHSPAHSRALRSLLSSPKPAAETDARACLPLGSPATTRAGLLARRSIGPSAVTIKFFPAGDAEAQVAEQSNPLWSRARNLSACQRRPAIAPILFWQTGRTRQLTVPLLSGGSRTRPR